MAKNNKHKFVKCKNNPKFLVDTAYLDEKAKYNQEKVTNYPGHEKYGFMKDFDNFINEVENEELNNDEILETLCIFRDLFKKLN